MALMQIIYLSIGSVPTITQVVTQELSRYNYTFPTPPNVSTLFFCNSRLISVQSDPLRAVPNRARPYRNSRIIAVIRELCFTGGANSFADRYHLRFPTSEGDDGRVVREVPVAMVALVATAVSDFFLCGRFVLTQIISSMPASTIGNLANINPLTFQRTRTSMCTMVMSKPSTTLLRTGTVCFTV